MLTAALLGAALASLVVGCARKPAAPAPAAKATPGPVAVVEMDGVIHVARSVPVTHCYVGKPGAMLLNGYSVSFGGDDVVESGEVLVPEYSADGTYAEAASKREAGARGPSWVIVNVARGPGFPHGTTLEERPQTVVRIQISEHGMSGRADFSDYMSLYGRAGDERGGLVSGSIQWRCPEVKRGAGA